jgi:hypothetical protein
MTPMNSCQHRVPFIRWFYSFTYLKLSYTATTLKTPNTGGRYSSPCTFQKVFLHSYIRFRKSSMVPSQSVQHTCSCFKSGLPMLCFWSPKTWPISIMLKYPASFLHITFFHLRSSYCHELFKQIYPLIHFKICSFSKLFHAQMPSVSNQIT